jgi:hypothetical protein
VDKPSRFGTLTTSQLLSRILEDPDLVVRVQSLDSRSLGRLVERIGLEDSGELLSLAATGQIIDLLDADLWKSDRPGLDETFDADRFVVWLEVMLEAGEEFVARKLTELPEDLVMLALYAHVLVINIDELAVEMAGRGEDVDLTEKALDSCLYHEFAEYQIISRRYEGFNALVAVLSALDEEHHDFLQRLLDRCCRLSREFIEDNGGLYNVLTSEEMLESDAAADREDRRAARGFIAPSAAASFLALAKETSLEELVKSSETDPVTGKYFRELENSPGADERREADENRRAGNRLIAVLRQAGVAEETAPALPAPSDREGAGTLFRRAMLELRAGDPKRYAQRMQELAYLANILMAGHSTEGRRYRPSEAAQAAVDICNRGLTTILGGGEKESSAPRAARVVADESAVKLFMVGWHELG